MTFWENFSETISIKSKEMADKAKNFTDIASLKGQIVSYENTISRYYKEIGRVYYEAHKEDAQKEFPEQMEAIADAEKMIEELELSVRAYNCLKRASINSMSELLKKSEHDLLNIKNFGKKSSDEVIERLHHFGLDLAPNPEMDEEGMVIESAE